jgi:hypothetical protein
LPRLRERAPGALPLSEEGLTMRAALYARKSTEQRGSKETKSVTRQVDARTKPA